MTKLYRDTAEVDAVDQFVRLQEQTGRRQRGVGDLRTKAVGDLYQSLSGTVAEGCTHGAAQGDLKVLVGRVEIAGLLEDVERILETVAVFVVIEGDRLADRHVGIEITIDGTQVAAIG